MGIIEGMFRDIFMGIVNSNEIKFLVSVVLILVCMFSVYMCAKHIYSIKIKIIFSIISIVICFSIYCIFNTYAASLM